MGSEEHIRDNSRISNLQLDETDRSAIAELLEVFAMIPGDCGDEYRRPPFLTASGAVSYTHLTLPTSDLV